MTARDLNGRFTSNPLPSSIIAARKRTIRSELTAYITATPREQRAREMDWRMAKTPVSSMRWRLSRILDAFKGHHA